MGEANTPPADARSSMLDAELADLVRAGLSQQLWRDDPERLVRFLLQAWLDLGLPERALVLLRRLPLERIDVDACRRVARALRERGDGVGAVEALVCGLRASPTDWNALIELAEIDPVAGVALLRELRAAHPALDPDLRDGEFHMLLVAGDDAGIRAEVAARRAQPVDPEEPVPRWKIHLATYAPALAVELLGGEPVTRATAALGIALAGALRELGQDERASALLVDVLAVAPPASLEASQARWALLDLDPAALLAVVDAALREQDADVTQRFRARVLGRLGRRQEAVDLLLALRRRGATDIASDLYGLDPDLALRVAREDGDGSSIGYLGNHAWRAGRRDEALRLWREAQSIEPDDTRWAEQVRKA
ncbi:MAG: hypothetical protein AB7O84_24695, partial [Planctomycetota bacterium]